jgi:hypothetical protein
MAIYTAQNLAYPDSVADKPASHPIAKAIRHPSHKGLAAQFALPGLVPSYVRDREDRVQRFDTEEAAEFAALRVMRAVLESRMRDPRKATGYNRMTPAEFAAALVDADLTATEFSEIYGVPQSRVMGWIDGIQDIPHSAAVLVRLMAIEENYIEARSMTDRAQGLRKD